MASFSIPGILIVLLHYPPLLQLGCGSALPGIVAMLLGAQVDFQDYVRPPFLDRFPPDTISLLLHSPLGV